MIADGRVGGSKFLNMHNTRATLQNSAGGPGKVAFMTLKILQFVAGSRSRVKNQPRREDETFEAPFLRTRWVEKNVMRSRHLRC